MKKIFNYKINDIIQANLSFQTTQKILKNSLNLSITSIEDLVKNLPKYKFLTDAQKKMFLYAIGGKANFRKTKEFIEKNIGAINDCE